MGESPFLNSSPFNLAPANPQVPVQSTTFSPFPASFSPSPAVPSTTARPALQQSTFGSPEPIVVGNPSGQSLPTVPPQLDLSTSQQPAVVKAGEDYYYYYYYYDEDEGGETADEAAATS